MVEESEEELNYSLQTIYSYEQSYFVAEVEDGVIPWLDQTSHFVGGFP